MNKFDIIELGQQTMQFTYDTFMVKLIILIHIQN